MNDSRKDSVPALSMPSDVSSASEASSAPIQPVSVDNFDAMLTEVIYQARRCYEVRHGEAWARALNVMCDALRTSGVFGKHGERDPRNVATD